MRKHHPKNERIKRLYLNYLEDVMGRDRKTVDLAAAAIALFEASTNWKDFRHFHFEQARKFKRDMDDHLVEQTGQPLSASTKVSRLRAVKAFFVWLAGQPGYRGRLKSSDMEYFNAPAKDARIASATRLRRVPTLEQVRHVLATMPAETALDRRDRAIIALTVLCAPRDGALISLKHKHVELSDFAVHQDARDVSTKNAKSFTTWFAPMGRDLETIVEVWLMELKTVHLFGPDDPLFPATAIGLDGEGQFAAKGLSRSHWADAAPVRKIFRKAFEGAGLPYCNPHSLRTTHWLWVERADLSRVEEKALSQNIGHEHIRTSSQSYGPISVHEQRDLIHRVRARIYGEAA
ncbi:MAG: tyrosine recombinase XerC [Aestuariivirga sp.]